MEKNAILNYLRDEVKMFRAAGNLYIVGSDERKSCHAQAEGIEAQITFLEEFWENVVRNYSPNGDPTNDYN